MINNIIRFMMLQFLRASCPFKPVNVPIKVAPICLAQNKSASESPTMITSLYLQFDLVG